MGVPAGWHSQSVYVSVPLLIIRHIPPVVTNDGAFSRACRNVSSDWLPPCLPQYQHFLCRLANCYAYISLRSLSLQLFIARIYNKVVYVCNLIFRVINSTGDCIIESRRLSCRKKVRDSQRGRERERVYTCLNQPRTPAVRSLHGTTVPPSIM